MEPSSRPRRLAWIGDADSGGGVTGMCRVLLLSLVELGVEVDWYTRSDPEAVPELSELIKSGRLQARLFPYPWNWQSWYGRNPKLAFLMSFVKRAGASRRMNRALVERHRRAPFDAIVQFSQGELLSLRPYARELPLVLYPCVHAAGELRWCRREEHLARRCESGWWRGFRLLYLGFRARLQRRDYHLAKGVLGLSRQFNREVQRDYNLPPERLGVVYHPIESGKPVQREESRRVRLLFVGRVSVRKGIDVLIAALPSLLAGDAELEVAIIGSGSLWSNYEPLLSGLPEARCVWHRSLPNDEVRAAMEQADVLLIPSSYEPGGIVVGEALACGMVIAASDAVGSAENLPAGVCFAYPAVEKEQFAHAVRSAVAAVRAGGPALRQEARKVAAEQFAPQLMGHQLMQELERLLGLSNSPDVPSIPP